MLKKIVAVGVMLGLILCLCGCDMLAADTAELLSPPALSGDLKPIAEAIDASVDGAYDFKYPSRGDYRSAVVQEDINSDGIHEAFAFYSTTDGETITMHINAVTKRDDAWKSVAQQKIVAGGVDRVDFCDLDNDGIKEILVGWEIYGTSEMQLAVYGMSDSALTQRMLQKYTHFITCDLDENDQNEILLIKTAVAEQGNSAALFAFTQEGITEISSCALDSTVKTVNEPMVATLSNGKPAVYIDEIKGVGAVTEVLFMEKGDLVNPLIDAATGETLSTLRSVSFSVQDINQDNILEIPVQLEVPSVTNSELNEKLYLTNWCSFNGERLVSQTTAMINLNDGYFYTIPSKWIGNIAVLKDTENHLREIYRYDPEEMTVSDRLLYIKAVDKKDWDEGKYKADGVKEIVNNGTTSFICYISSYAQVEGITYDSVKSSFRLLE